MFLYPFEKFNMRIPHLLRFPWVNLVVLFETDSHSFWSRSQHFPVDLNQGMFPFIFQGFKLIERKDQVYFDLRILKERFCGVEVGAA